MGLSAYSTTFAQNCYCIFAYIFLEKYNLCLTFFQMMLYLNT